MQADRYIYAKPVLGASPILSLHGGSREPPHPPLPLAAGAQQPGCGDETSPCVCAARCGAPGARGERVSASPGLPKPLCRLQPPPAGRRAGGWGTALARPPHERLSRVPPRRARALTANGWRLTANGSRPAGLWGGTNCEGCLRAPCHSRHGGTAGVVFCALFVHPTARFQVFVLAGYQFAGVRLLG